MMVRETSNETRLNGTKTLSITTDSFAWSSLQSLLPATRQQSKHILTDQKTVVWCLEGITWTRHGRFQLRAKAHYIKFQWNWVCLHKIKIKNCSGHVVAPLWIERNHPTGRWQTKYFKGHTHLLLRIWDRRQTQWTRPLFLQLLLKFGIRLFISKQTDLIHYFLSWSLNPRKTERRAIEIKIHFGKNRIDEDEQLSKENGNVTLWKWYNVYALPLWASIVIPSNLMGKNISKRKRMTKNAAIIKEAFSLSRVSPWKYRERRVCLCPWRRWIGRQGNSRSLGNGQDQDFLKATKFLCYNSPFVFHFLAHCTASNQRFIYFLEE